MALTELYKLPKTIERHRQEPLGCFIDGFQEWLKVNQFSLSTMICHISYVTGFSEYLVKQSISHPVNIRSEHIELFSRQYDRQNATTQKIRPALYAVNRFLSYYLASHFDEPSDRRRFVRVDCAESSFFVSIGDRVPSLEWCRLCSY